MKTLRKTPHLILIMTDQHRADALGCMGNEKIITPNIDQLALDGIVYSAAYTATPSCTPARAGLLTGLTPWHHGMLGYGQVATHYKYELPRLIRESGYYTFGIGKMHWHPQRALHGFHGTLLDESGRIESPDFVSDYRKWFKDVAPHLDPDATGIGWNDNKWGDYALPERLHPTKWTADQAISIIEKYIKRYKDKDKDNDNENDKDKDKKETINIDKDEYSIPPLFLKISFARPHSPYDAPSRFANLYDWKEMPEPFKGNWDKKFKKWKKKPNPAYGDFGDEFAKRARRHYYGNITFIDEEIGRIIDTLKKKKMFEDCLIIFTSDHGDMLGDHYHWRKTYPYEGSAKIPMILKLPDNLDLDLYNDPRLKRFMEYRKNSEQKFIYYSEPVELRDILPTFLDAIGVEIPDEIDGLSLLNTIRMKYNTINSHSKTADENREKSDNKILSSNNNDSQKNFTNNIKWREYLGLEHCCAYAKYNNWVALTDGKWKYIYYRRDGKEQLFNIINDSTESVNLSSNSNYYDELIKWRNRMVDYLSERGEDWVENGKLRKTRSPKKYSPNYPEIGEISKKH